jgi:hypothetical protein
MTYVIEDGGRANLYAKEPPMTIMDVTETMHSPDKSFPASGNG